MKTSLFNSLLVASLLVFAVGCGKEKSKGKGNYYASLYNQGLSATNQAVVQKVTTWYNSNVEGQANLNRPGTIVRTKYVINNSQNGQNCVDKKFLGIPYKSCTYSNTTPTGTPVSSTPAQFYPDNIVINARGNIELNNIFNGSNGTLINAQDLTQYASQLDFLRADGTVVSFIIDRNLHSSMNPVVKSEITTASKTITEAIFQPL